MEENDQLVLICGFSGTGKSASLMNIPNKDKWLYLNTESGKRLPFKNNFKSVRVKHPDDVIQAFDLAINNKDKVDGIILDSLTFLMEMYETKCIIESEEKNKMNLWSNYNQYFKKIFQDKVIKFEKPVIITAHVQSTLDESKMEMTTSVPVKGALKGTGVEAYFSTIVATKKVPLTVLENYKSDLLHITETDELLGYKHVFQTRLTKDTTGERIRSPLGMFEVNETFMDNDVNLLLKRLNEFYN